ncbi:putative transcription factor homeobox-WOX family [Helianthus anomalus]
METNDNINGQTDGFKKPKRQMKTPYQLEILEKTYGWLTDRQLQMWFCHRRLKEKKEEIVKKVVGEQMEVLKSSKRELIVAERDGSRSGFRFRVGF